MKFKVGDMFIHKNGDLCEFEEMQFRIDEVSEDSLHPYLSYGAGSFSEEYIDNNYDLVTFPTCREDICGPESAKRFNSGKVEFDTLPWVGIVEMAKNSMYGTAKYDKYNFKKEGESSQYFNCKMRHMLKHHMGSNIDQESKVYHLSCEAWNALVEIEHIIQGNLTDDRHKYDEEFIENVFTLNDDQQEVIKKVTDDKKEK